MKQFKILSTDFYQIPMVLAYIEADIADQITGFESFYRHTKKEITKNNFYIFSG
jgi:nicotinic acid phosphoribosyltransferase